MEIINKIYKSNLIHHFPRKIIRKLFKKFKIYFVEISLNKLPEISFPKKSNLEYQEQLIDKFNNNLSYRDNTSCPYIMSIINLIFHNKDQVINFLDFGGERIDTYLSLRKKYNNLNYFIFNQKEVNLQFSELKKKRNLKNFYVLENLDQVRKGSFEFINLGSVIQYIPNYKDIINILVNSSKKYIFFSGIHLYSGSHNKSENIIVKQINLLPDRYYCYFFNFTNFNNLLISNNFDLKFKIRNVDKSINYRNFRNKFGNITYDDIFYIKRTK